MAIIRHGKIIEHQTLKGRVEEGIIVRVETTQASPKLATVLAEQPGVELVESSDAVCLFRFNGDKLGLHGILSVLVKNEIPVYKFGEDKINMHEAYLQKVTNFKTDSQR